MPIMICTAIVSCLSLRVISVASADIYLDVNDQTVIRLSNVPVEKTFRVLVTDKKRLPPPARLVNDVAAMRTSYYLPFAELVLAAAQEMALEPELLHAVISTESRHDPNAARAWCDSNRRRGGIQSAYIHELTDCGHKAVYLVQAVAIWKIFLKI